MDTGYLFEDTSDTAIDTCEECTSCNGTGEVDGDIYPDDEDNAGIKVICNQCNGTGKC